MEAQRPATVTRALPAEDTYFVVRTDKWYPWPGPFVDAFVLCLCGRVEPTSCTLEILFSSTLTPHMQQLSFIKLWFYC